MIFFLFLVTVKVKVHALFIHLVILLSYRRKFLQIICVYGNGNKVHIRRGFEQLTVVGSQSVESI